MRKTSLEKGILLAHSLSGPSSSWQSLRGSKKLFGGRNLHTGFLASPHLNSLEQVAEVGQEMSSGYKPAGLSLRQVPLPRVTTAFPDSARRWGPSLWGKFCVQIPTPLLFSRPDI